MSVCVCVGVCVWVFVYMYECMRLCTSVCIRIIYTEKLSCTKIQMQNFIKLEKNCTCKPLQNYKLTI